MHQCIALALALDPADAAAAAAAGAAAGALTRIGIKCRPYSILHRYGLHYF